MGLTRSGLQRISRSEHSAAALDGIKPLPDHRDDRPGGHELDNAGEERFSFVFGIICRIVLVGYY
jgi:hypothetical protein